MTLTKKALIEMYKKYTPKFELLPNESLNLNEALDYYKKKLREFEILATSINKAGFEIPDFILSNGVNYSVKIRQLEKRIKLK